jgi:hypothetical protein
MFIIATLTLGSWPRQMLAKVRIKSGLESHISCPRGVESMGECENWTSTLPSEVPLWELESRWSLKFSKSNFRGQNPSDWDVPYNVENVLEHRCLKWVCMTNLDIWNTIYGQKKGHESNWQIDSRPFKVVNWPNSLACRWCATYYWKSLDEGCNFPLDLILIGGLHIK